MPLKIDQEEARTVLEAAIAAANDPSTPVSADWTEITEVVASGPSVTLITGLGAALLAKATKPNVDPLAWKPEERHPRSASLRPMVENVLVPLSKGGETHPPFHLGSTGGQPFNNQPFFRYSHFHEVERHKAGETLDYLATNLSDLDHGPLEGTAFEGLVAFIRSRTRAQSEEDARRAENLPSVEDLAEVRGALESFLLPGGVTKDRPLRLQAVVGGLIRATGEQVSAQRVNDPSRHAPGDVHVPDQFAPTWVAEVKARPMSQAAAERFVSEAAAYQGIKSTWIVAIDPDHEPLNRSSLSELGSSRGILVSVSETVDELLATFMGHPGVDPSSLHNVAEAVATQLNETAATGETVSDWRAEFVDLDQ